MKRKRLTDTVIKISKMNMDELTQFNSNTDMSSLDRASRDMLTEAIDIQMQFLNGDASANAAVVCSEIDDVA